MATQRSWINKLKSARRTNHSMQTITETQVRLFASAKSWIEGEAVRQLYATAKLDGVQLAVGFPDLHPGKGGPVGAAFLTRGILYPHLVGSDIGCGMTLWQTDFPRRKAKPDRWSKLAFDLEHPWEGIVAGWLQDNQLPSTRCDAAMGTIGGGNHFAELQAVERIHSPKAFAALGIDRENLVVLVHSGSRSLGEAILWDYAAEHGSSGSAPESAAGRAYLEAHDMALRWARASREIIVRRFLETLGSSGVLIWDGCHNSITPKVVDGEPLWLHRKGSAPSEGGPLVIAGTRGTVSYLVQPTGDGASHGWSLAHGAGRKWSRSESRSRMRERFCMEELVQTPLGGRVICENRDLLYEEAPQAYKPIERVIDDLEEAGLIQVVATLRPLFTYKTRAQRR